VTTRPLEGRAAVVTGASRGIGLAVARALGTAGAQVALVARSAATLEREAAAIGGGACAFAADLADAKQVERLSAALRERFATVPDIVVNNAGVFRVAPLHAVTPGEFAETVQTNLVAPFFLVHAVLREMRARGSGHVITIGSVADRHPFPENGAYAAAKFGARALHEVLRAELRGTGVRATLISPGPVDTSIWDPILAEGRPGYPTRDAMLGVDAVADAVVWAATRPPGVNIDELRLSRT
jgi:NADP-dependent 3-hydroxy acid dehydrogenase YdfG